MSTASNVERTLRTDNRTLPDGTHTLTIAISDDDIERKIASFFGWRTPTAEYDTFTQRWRGLGSSRHDDFIEHLWRTRH